ncbi:MAG: right-handed parallel beta-helix repeat-containing protein [Candidatus Bathyarchaeota archaeon]|nr:MAG: right-handed parallel beta-helix repeat-containing protein [Candidatus Bathyarchaeota archaeon]
MEFTLMFLIRYEKEKVMIGLKKAISTSFMILCLLSLILGLKGRLSVGASPNVLYVPTIDYPTIQSAIDSAASGDTIFVYSGTYYEHIVVNKSILLVGENMVSTIIDGGGSGDAILIRRTDNVTIQGFTIRNCSHGISLEHSNQDIIRNNKITNTHYGVGLYTSYGSVISNNIISANSVNGIELYSSSSNLISDNAITLNSLDGIFFSTSSNNVISRNTITSNGFYGVYFFSQSNNNTAYHNNFNNLDDASSGPDSLNIWDFGGEGNYWSSYNGIDVYRGPFQNETGSDGIGDTPYLIDADEQDNYPLLGAFSIFTPLEGESYQVSIISNSSINNFRFEIGVETGSKIIRFNVAGENASIGFCRVVIPSELMAYPYLILAGSKEITPTLLEALNETQILLYFTYNHDDQTITIVSPEILHLYNELLENYTKLQIEFTKLNMTFYEFLSNYTVLNLELANHYSEFLNMNTTYYDLLGNYSVLLQELNNQNHQLSNLSAMFYDLLGNYSVLLQELNNQNQEHQVVYSETTNRIRDLTYACAAIAAVFIIATVYLSNHAHGAQKKVGLHEDEE